MSLLLLGFYVRTDRLAAPPPPLWGRTEEGGRADLSHKRVAAHSLISSVRATPHPYPPPQEGAGALTPSVPPKCGKLDSEMTRGAIVVAPLRATLLLS